MTAITAETEASATLQRVADCLKRKRSFKLEAGAGAGKTHSLVEALKLVINAHSKALLRRRQQIACITYTNVATEQIRKRTDAHPAVFSSTIHSFCWALCKGFPKTLRELLPTIEGWSELLESVTDFATRTIGYDLGHRRAKPDEREVMVGHNDVLKLFSKMLDIPKFRTYVVSRFPYVFIDEYQDTDKDVAASLKRYFIETGSGWPVFGLFGDSWQKIYGHGCGLLSSGNVEEIPKGSNFRSSEQIIGVLNRMRPGLRQIGRGISIDNAISVFHSNGWTGTRQRGHHKDDLPEEEIRRSVDAAKTALSATGWDLSPEKTKILMLTHKALAREQTYAGIVACFEDTDAWYKKEHSVMQFLLDALIPAWDHYCHRRYGLMFDVLGLPKSAVDKQAWKRELDVLGSLILSGTIGDVLRRSESGGVVSVPDKVSEFLRIAGTATPPQRVDATKLLDVPCSEVVNLDAFIADRSPYATKHGVKGAEFENVLVICGRGWAQYDWSRFLEMSENQIPDDQAEFFERNRNLFYVACSRPKLRLGVIFTQKLSATATSRVSSWFGPENVRDIYSS